jgi:hypothetical protein
MNVTKIKVILSTEPSLTLYVCKEIERDAHALSQNNPLNYKRAFEDHCLCIHNAVKRGRCSP